MARAKKATEAPTDPLDAMLARLQLSGIRDQLDSLLDEAARANLSARETLILLCEREIARKDHRRIEMGLKLDRQRRERAAARPAWRRQDALVDRARAGGDPGRIHGAVHDGDDPGRWPCQGARRAAPG